MHQECSIIWNLIEKRSAIEFEERSFPPSSSFKFCPRNFSSIDTDFEEERCDRSIFQKEPVHLFPFCKVSAYNDAEIAEEAEIRSMMLPSML